MVKNWINYKNTHPHRGQSVLDRRKPESSICSMAEKHWISCTRHVARVLVLYHPFPPPPHLPQRVSPPHDCCLHQDSETDWTGCMSDCLPVKRGKIIKLQIPEKYTKVNKFVQYRTYYSRKLHFGLVNWSCHGIWKGRDISLATKFLTRSDKEPFLKSPNS